MYKVYYGHMYNPVHSCIPAITTSPYPNSYQLAIQETNIALVQAPNHKLKRKN